MAQPVEDPAIVTTVAQVPALAQEFPCALGVAGKKNVAGIMKKVFI